MTTESLIERASGIKNAALELAQEATHLETLAQDLVQRSSLAAPDIIVMELTIFVLAIFVGYYVVWRVTPALHSSLMSVTNAISSVIVVGALIAAGPTIAGVSTTFGFLAVILASINIFGGFMVTHRILQMFIKSR